jgi:prepilin-type N-terminal cleavage/methylation domain-containing protein
MTKDEGRRTKDRRRGITLIEMLVTVAVLVILMTILVQIFQAATGSVSAAQAYQQLDEQLRRIDGMIRSDLEGVTARFTPPLDPAQNLGYFEYGENEFADSQGEDSDDYIRFTAKAPAGRPFTGRMWVGNTQLNPAFLNSSGTAQPVTITSEYAEIIYFVRNGNLYRRVLLVNPELQSQIVPALSIPAVGILNNTGYRWVDNPPTGATLTVTFTFAGPGGQVVSWQGVNDLSARPAASGPNTVAISNLPPAQRHGAFAQQTIVLNTLGDLTNRENRFASPRFSNDFWNAAGAGPAGPDGVSDDRNGDNVPDYYPSLYYALALTPANNGATQQLVFEPLWPNVPRTGADPTTMAFPWVFPGAYSVPQGLASYQYGWIHSPTSIVQDKPSVGNNTYLFDGSGTGAALTQSLTYIQNINHNPLDIGDNQTTGDSNPTVTPTAYYSPTLQTWWGFPTWRETLSPNWNDPTVQPNVQATYGPKPFQPNGLNPRPANTRAVLNDGDLLPPMAPPNNNNNWANNFSTIRRTPQLFSDGLGGTSNFTGGAASPTPALPLWTASWEDDLIMTGVRSFDVKAYDDALANYADLGWGDDLRLYLPYQTVQGFVGMPTQPPALASTPLVTTWPPVDPTVNPNTRLFSTLDQTFAHEGRMPPLTGDGRVDAQYGDPRFYLPSTSPYLVANGGTYTGNIGDNSPGIIRLRRVWDSWSTAYSKSPGTGLDNTTGFPVGPPFTPPIYPSYPPPYPAPLRGIQIQIRVVDPTNQRIKAITIRQDFTDKL